MHLPIATLLAAGLLAGNVVLGYYSAPTEILLTPLVVVVTTLLLMPANAKRPKSFLSATLAALLICAHDAGVKLYGGGAHDLAGQGFIHAFLFFGLLPAYLLLLHRVSQVTGISAKQKWAAYLVFPLVLAVHLALFGWLGVSR